MELGKMICDYMKEKSNIETIFSEHGFIMYKQVPDNESIFICDMYIDQMVRGLGHGKKLLHALEIKAANMGFKKINTCIGDHKWMATSMSQHISQGFKPIGIDRNQIVYEKSLEGVL